MLTAMAESVSKSDLTGSTGISEWFADQLANFTPFNVVVVLLAGLLAGVIISLVYKKTYRGVLYSPTFSLTLIMLTLVTAPVVMAIGSNVALSMGMVGALSIVRFRTAVKEPLDTAYMFWAITMGILLGAGQYLIALVVVIGISVILLALSFLHFRTPNCYLLVMHFDEFSEKDIESELKRSVRFWRLRSKTVTRAGAEATFEVRLDHRSDLVAHMLDLEGVHDATLVACETETGA